jgi:hypothetical protein
MMHIAILCDSLLCHETMEEIVNIHNTCSSVSLAHAEMETEILSSEDVFSN